MAKVLREKHSEDRLHILVAKRNSGNFTYDGVELGGERVCQEIEEEIERLEKAGTPIKKISIAGYSLGGLVARYAIGLLYAQGIFEKVTPMNFTTFATPHIGVRSPRLGWHNSIWNILGARTLSNSGRQMFIIDQFRDTGRPLLSVLADSNSIFIKGLASFKRRILYANIANDRSVPYYTAMISTSDPYEKTNDIQINYLKNSDEVLVSPTNPVSPRHSADLPPKWYRRILTTTQTTITQLPLFLGLVIFIPIGVVAFLINSGIQTFTSNRRIRLHEAGQAGINFTAYRTPLMITEMRGAMESAYENLNNARSYGDHLDEAVEQEEGLSSPTTSLTGAKLLTASDKSAGGQKEKTVNQSIADEVAGKNIAEDEDVRLGDVKVPALALTPDQFAMVQALDDCKWRKFPVHIHKVRHSHAAIIVRSNRSGLKEGYVVLNHWAGEEFLMD